MATPLCPYFGKCGGCTSQTTDYEYQLKDKKRQLAEAINFYDISVHADKEYFYRNRMDFIFHPSGLGLRERGNWKNIVDIKECVISDKRLNELLKEVREFSKTVDAFDVRKHSGTFRYAVIRTPQNDSSISFVLNSESMQIQNAIEKIKAFAEKSSANNVIITYVDPETDTSTSEDFFAVKGSDMLKETYLEKTFSYSAQGFFQNNSVVAEKMHQYVNELIKKHDLKYMNLLDLYAGVGTFGIINADLFKSVTIVESFKQCVDAAELNIKENHVKNAKAICLDAMKLKKLRFDSPLFVITDPPRSGMHPKTIMELNELKPKVIIYVSCNVEQLGKDLLKFNDYELRSAALFDLFPQTPHAEAVVELVRKN